MSTTTRAWAVPRTTACPCRIIISRVTGRVESSPCATMPSESPTSTTSQCGSTMAAICAEAAVRATILRPSALRRARSGAVRRRDCTTCDMAWPPRVAARPAGARVAQS